MTWEEAIEILQKRKRYCKVIAKYANKTVKTDELREVAAIDRAISALRPITRDQVEKVWKRCKRCAATKDEAFNPGIAHNFSVFDDAIYYCDSDYGWEGESILFCPWCGMPLTDAALDMVMKRLEALKDA